MEKTFSLILTEAEVNYLGQVLAERPFKEVAALFAKVNQQVAGQAAPKPPPPLPDATEA